MTIFSRSMSFLVTQLSYHIIHGRIKRFIASSLGRCAPIYKDVK